MILEVNVLPEYEGQHDQEIDIVLDSGPTVQMCVTEDTVDILRNSRFSLMSFDITDRTPCGQHVRAINFQFESKND